ncbi:MAG: hypothetical protein ACE5HP_07510 [Gemmatimonadota bacterium]
MRKASFERSRVSVPLAAGTVALLAAACGGDGTGPGDGPDLTPLAAELSTGVASTIRNNSVLTSMLGLRGAMLSSLGSPPGGSVGQPLRLGSYHPIAGRGTGDPVETASGEAGLAGGLFFVSRRVDLAIPFGFLGRTLIWNVDTDAYDLDPDDEFLAPANGVRFRLYTLASQNSPLVPLLDVGFIDLIDVSSGGGIDVSGTIRDDNVARAAFQTNGVLGVEFDFGATGFFSDGASNIDFSARTRAGTGGFTLVTTVDATVGSVTYGSSTEVTGNGAGTKEVAVSAGGLALQFLLNFDPNGNIGSNSTVTVNGMAGASVSGSFSNPSVKRISGSNLSNASLDALEAIFQEGFELETASANLLLFGFLVNQGLD